MNQNEADGFNSKPSGANALLKAGGCADKLGAKCSQSLYWIPQNKLTDQNLTALCYTLNYHTPGDCYYKPCEGHKESLPPLGALLLILLYMFLLLWLQPWCALSGGGAFKIRRRKEKKGKKSL